MNISEIKKIYPNKTYKTYIWLVKAIKLHGLKYDYSKIDYNHSEQKSIIICPEHGEFEQRIVQHINGTACPKCSINRVKKLNTKTNEQFLKKANKIHNNFYKYPEEYINSQQKIKIICPEHGEFEQKVNAHLRGQGCAKCAYKIKSISKLKTHEQFLIEANLKHNNFYKYPEKYKHSEQKIKIICPEHGEFEQLPFIHLRGSKCPKCSSEKVGFNKRLYNETDYFEQVKIIHKNKYKYFGDYITTQHKIKIECPEHGIFYQFANNHLAGKGCPKCVNQISKAEQEIIDYLKELDIEKIVTNNRSLLNGQELDIYLPDYNLAIEFNGLYWHSDEFREDNYHKLKTENCLSKNIQLIHIFEDEWQNKVKQEIVKSRLRNLLGKNEFKIYGRNTYIKEIDSITSRKFLENNHIQGFVGAKVHLGLFYFSKERNKEYLVSVMSFGSLRKNLGQTNDDEYSFELLRFASLKNFNIIGGANKLLKYFEKHFNPKYIISYADRRWSQGKLYNQLGFEQSKISPPNYFYVDGLKRLNRFGYRKDILISKYGCKPEQTEREFCREKLNLTRIYDSGNYVFEKQY